MSLYGKKWTVDGVATGYVRRVGTKAYELRFEREYAKIEDVEGIDWNDPTVEKLGEEECPLPAGSFSASNITYDGAKKFYCVLVQLNRENYGDVSAYVAELEEKNEQITEKNAAIKALGDDLAEADSTVETLYERLSTFETRLDELTQELAEADEMVEALYEQLSGNTEENESNEEG